MPARTVVAGTPTWKEPRLADGRVFWLEQRPAEAGRCTLLMRPFATSGGSGDGGHPRELTPGRNLRSRVHEYGGGAYTVEGNTVVFVDDGDRCLWRLELTPGAPDLTGPGAFLPEPQRLTPPGDPSRPRAFADGLIDRRRHRWIGVMEQDGHDQLVAVPLTGGEPQPLHSPADFCGYAVLSPSGSHLAWVEWQQPSMPWERSQLWLGRLDGTGALVEAWPLAGSDGASPSGVSVFQPLWAGDDLLVATDRSGWWNLERLRAAETLASGVEPAWQPLLPMEAEFAMPQWSYGMATTVWDGGQVLASACRDGRWELGLLREAPGASADALDRSSGPHLWQSLELPFSDLAALAADAGRLVAIAGAPDCGFGLLELDTRSGAWRHTPAAEPVLAASAISLPEPLWFEGHGGLPTHAWYYPPAGGGHPQAPLLLRAHGGPTGMARTSLDLGVQFWTSRGWGVVDVNYSGSTGFGRAYRERLNGGWGVTDVNDCVAAARAVVVSGRASAERIAIEGGSAGGLTVLAALCVSDVFRAGACRYAVTDLGALARDTHRFEARYLDGLVGPWPAAREIYEARSPLRQVDHIHSPVIFFQGLDDKVVPPEQTERMALALTGNGVPVEVHLFPGEGHGFRAGEVRIQVLEATEAFFRRHFGL